MNDQIKQTKKQISIFGLSYKNFLLLIATNLTSSFILIFFILSFVGLLKLEALISHKNNDDDNYYVHNLDINIKTKKFIENKQSREKILRHLDNYTNNRKISETILDKSILWDVPIDLAFGLAWAESRFDPRAINSANNRNNTRDLGLFQLNDGFRSNWKLEDFFNVEKNTEAAMEQLNLLLQKFDYSYVLVVAAYNAGINGINRGVTLDTLKLISNTINFSKKVEKEINSIIFEIK